MIREVGKTIKIIKQIEVEEIATKEKITAISINPDGKILNVTILLLNGNDQILGERIMTLSKEDYDLLFSKDAYFDEGKQEGSYREIDLWKMIDKVSNR